MTRFNLTKIERGDMITAMEAGGNTGFDLQPPSYLPDDLDEATTNDDFGPEIEIEVVDKCDGSDDWYAMCEKRGLLSRGEKE